MIGQALLPRVLALLSPEARALIVAVVQVARGAADIGPPSPPPHVVEWCREAAGDAVPWQLLAAALALGGGPVMMEQMPFLVEHVQELGLVEGVRAWAMNDRDAERIILAFLAFTARELEPDALDTLAESFRATVG